MARARGNRMLHGFGWSGAYMILTRATTLAAVPIVLHGLGTRLYAVWVLAGSLVLIQSLFDLGVASALVRYVAVAATSGSRSAVVVITRRALIFYVLLSALVALPLWFEAGALVRLVSFLRPAEHAAGVVIVRWALVAFALTNLSVVLAATLQGIDRVGESYRDQAAGWLLYLPLLLVGLSAWPHPEAVGVAWVAAFGVQLLLLARTVIVSLKSVGAEVAPIPSFGAMLSFGGKWQISAWADFASFQLPRFVASFALSAASVLTLDVAIRAGQLVVGPLFAFYPTVLPKAASLLTSGGTSALRSFLQRYYSLGIVLVIAGGAVAIPLEVPALATWTGRTAGSFDPLVAAAVLVGTVAHASTGLLTSALLARGDVNSVIAYKGRQLGLAVVLLSITAPLGLLPVALALCTALTLPALLFNARAARMLGLGSPLRSATNRRRLAGYALVQLAVPGGLVLILADTIAAWKLLVLASFAALACAALLGSLLRRRPPARSYPPEPAGSAPLIEDHFARK